VQDTSAAASLVLVASPAPEGEQWLAPRERESQARLRLAKRREDWRLGRWAAKRAALAQGLVGELAAAEVRAAPGGAPELWIAERRWPGTLSLSHSGGRALAALRADGEPLGADLERVEERSAGFVEDYFTPAEQAAWRSARLDARPLVATLTWSAKESALKALGEGLRLPTTSVEVRLLSEGGHEPGWQALEVRVPGEATALTGFWRRDGPDLLTLVGPRLERPPQELA